MSSFLRPRRGKKATAVAQLTASNPLKRGEIFFEVPDGGVGTGTGALKMGDGSTAYDQLPYFMKQPTVDYTNAVVAWTDTSAADSSPYTTNAGYIGNITPSASLKTIFTNLKKLLLNYNSQLTSLNNDLSDSKHLKFIGDVGNKTATELYDTYSKQNTDIYFGIFDWTSTFAKTMDSNNGICMIFKWIVISITNSGIWILDNDKMVRMDSVSKWADYTVDIGTNNTVDTWVPVINGNKVQHRVIPPKLPSYSLSGTTLTITQ